MRLTGGDTEGANSQLEEADGDDAARQKVLIT